MTLIKTTNLATPIRTRFIYEEGGLSSLFAFGFWILLGYFILASYDIIEIHFPILKSRTIGCLIALIWVLIPQMAIIGIGILQDLRIIKPYNVNPVNVEFL